jgi:hypothetical protein
MFHGLMNIAQGVYSIISPQGYAALAGDMFAGAPDKALQSIGKPFHVSNSAYQRHRHHFGYSEILL